MLRAEGWEQSFGMNYERERFEAERKPIVMMDPDIVPPEFLDQY
jgi:hypothetical protein